MVLGISLRKSSGLGLGTQEQKDKVLFQDHHDLSPEAGAEPSLQEKRGHSRERFIELGRLEKSQRGACSRQCLTV